ncbi:Glyoxysomal fatty acid beta-oxidation multifunctional protein MFP-a [Dichanthelium oligosanthes]|uniref:Glyoxysomal fatty acid beta-oxidation multifunctional protein MFP-a n=1 Tax=Dichanthelium oligosanthes TaxID=888268 RepID=A0A1E5VEK6_9POAL|nr:Glyoxysomal fatty acid beta-oxidation multifunctional protein MFP-a [Dichanthelium oligosanthes]
MAKGSTAMEVRADGIAVITISNPPVNALSLDVLASLQRNYAEALSRSDVKAIVLTGAKGRFCGGFDITAFGKKPKNEKPGSLSIDFLSDIVEDAHKPSVAAIDGIALGGGLEVAMVCHARISTPSAQLGLPELQLGIIPGMGEIVENKRPWPKSLYRTDRLPDLVEVKDVLKFARVQTRKKAPNVQHPIVCIDVIEEGIVSGPRVGLMKEMLSGKMLEQSQTSKSLRHLFFAQRATSKIPNITNIGLTPRKIKKAAIVGGGLMGSGIATVLILNNFKVALKEVNEQFLSAGINRVKGNLQSFVRKGQLTKEDCEKKFSLLSGVLDYEQFRDADVVIEAAIEDILLKQQIFSDLEKYCHHNCILATNTSTIDLNLIGQKTATQDRIVGAHFFSPAHVMPLLEIVRTHQTSSQVIVDLLDVAKKIRKTPIVVGNCTGFAVNRMFFPYGQAASFLVDYGLDVYHIDHVITQFGMPMGPFRLADLVGFGVATATRKQYFQSYPERCYKSMLLLQILLEDNRTGESSRKGFYVYDDKRKASRDPDLRMYIEKSRNMAGVTQDPKLMKFTDNDIVEVILFPVVNEACRVLDEGISLKASDLDVASVMGMGFPSYSEKSCKPKLLLFNAFATRTSREEFTKGTISVQWPPPLCHYGICLGEINIVLRQILDNTQSDGPDACAKTGATSPHS